MKRAKISDFKARLSSYLAEVRAGDTLIVCDRETPVARVEPYEEGAGGLRVRAPKRPVSDLRKVGAGPPLTGVDVVALLREDRERG